MPKNLIERMSIFQSQIEVLLGVHGIGSDSAELIAEQIADRLWKSDFCHPGCRELYEECERREEEAAMSDAMAWQSLWDRQMAPQMPVETKAATHVNQ